MKNYLDNSLKKMIATHLLKNEIEDFIDYRQKLKKPIKVVEPIIKYIKSLQELEKLGYNRKNVIEEMKSRQWSTIQVDWICKLKNIYKGETKSEKNSQAIDYFNKYEIPVIEDCEVTVNENTT